MTNKPNPIAELLKISDIAEEAAATQQCDSRDLNPLDYAPDADTYWRALAAGEFQSQVFDANEGEGSIRHKGFTREELIQIVRESFKS